MQRRAVKGYGVLQVEPTDYCNLRCSMCPPHAQSWQQIHGIPKGFLSVEVWKNIVASLARDTVEFDHMIFQWLGDPLFHPHIDGIIAVAQDTLHPYVGYFRMDSNMILLTQKRVHKMLQSVNSGAPMLFVASIDAHSRETYTTVKGYDYLDVVRSNLRYLLYYRKKHNIALNLQVQFVVQKGNAHETIEFQRYWLDCLRCYGGDMWHDEIMFKRLSVEGGGEGQSVADTIYQQHVLDRGITHTTIDNVQINIWENKPWQHDDAGQTMQRSACPGLWSTPVIRHDGRLIMCCADLQGKLELGNLAEHSFLDLWLSPKAKQKRQEHLQGKFTGVCQSCGGINWYDLPPHYRQMV